MPFTAFEMASISASDSFDAMPGILGGTPSRIAVAILAAASSPAQSGVRSDFTPMAFPTGVSPFASAPWQEAHLAAYKAAPSGASAPSANAVPAARIATMTTRVRSNTMCSLLTLTWVGAGLGRAVRDASR
jgi:hypothetical protein